MDGVQVTTVVSIVGGVVGAIALAGMLASGGA